MKRTLLILTIAIPLFAAGIWFLDRNTHWAGEHIVGLEEFSVDVQRDGDATITSFSGFRMQGDGVDYINPKTRLQDNHFVELLYIVNPEDSTQSKLRNMARIIAATT